MNGLVEHFDPSKAGAAFAHGIYINPNKAVQSTFFHENAHIYWALLPDSHSGKKELLDLFKTEEDAIIEIGKVGTQYAKDQMNNTFWKKVLSALRKFWIGVKKMFGVKITEDPVMQMAMDIWHDKDGRFSNAEKLGTIKHTVNEDQLDYDEKTHTYKSGDIEFTSATQMIDRLRPEKFDSEIIAYRMARKESATRVSEGKNKPYQCKE
jgi:hypothetical protein